MIFKRKQSGIWQVMNDIFSVWEMEEIRLIPIVSTIYLILKHYTYSHPLFAEYWKCGYFNYPRHRCCFPTCRCSQLRAAFSRATSLQLLMEKDLSLKILHTVDSEAAGNSDENPHQNSNSIEQIHQSRKVLVVSKRPWKLLPMPSTDALCVMYKTRPLINNTLLTADVIPL